MALVMKKAKTSMKKASMKSKRVSIIARGKLARSAVLSGRKTKTSSGLTKEKLMRNKFGKIVSKAASAAKKKAYANSKLKKWGDAVKAARKSLTLTGFVAINGKSAQGKALYAKAKSLVSA